MILIELSLNGSVRSFEGPLSVAEMLACVGAPLDAVAVEVDRKVIPRSQHGSHTLHGGEKIEVVTLVGGG